MKKPELLLPAGNIEKLKYAIGADAVYLGVVDFSLRAMRKGELITLDNLKEAIDIAHQHNVKAYLTLNIFAFNEDIKLLEQAMDKIIESNPDAIILTDFGVKVKHNFSAICTDGIVEITAHFTNFKKMLKTSENILDNNNML